MKPDLIYRIYTQKAGPKGPTMRLKSTAYSEDTARKLAADLAIKGQWVKITTTPDENPPSRWD